MGSTDTIFALASGRPPAAIGLIRISGPLAHAAGGALAGALPRPREAALRRFNDPQSGFLIDEGLVLRFDGPASATGEDVVELHCHGGRAVVDALLSALAGVEGLREAQPGEFTRRAFDNGRIDLTEAEGLADLLEAETETQRRAALAMSEGGLRRQIEQWQDKLLALSARAEAAIDYAGDEDETHADLETLKQDCVALAEELEVWLQRPRVEPLKDGIKVVVAGPPNAGKSSLVNALAGVEKAIVSDIPGTTRDRIEVPLSIAGVPILLSDTAGLRDSGDEIERIGVGLAQASISASDILLWMGSAESMPAHPGAVLIVGKADLMVERPETSEALRVSARTGEGLDRLLELIANRAKSLLPAGDALALNRRQAQCLAEAHDALDGASHNDIAIIAEALRAARGAFDRLTGRSGVEDVLDALFGRFCLGK